MILNSKQTPRFSHNPRIMACKHRIFNYLAIQLSIFHVLTPSNYGAHSLSPLHGVHPLDRKYFASEVIKCKDGSNSFARDRLNDDFCDCIDGTDEPGTSACPRGKFYCRNLGSTPLFIFSSRVNDRICDCCDGSDEYDSGIHCPNSCVMGGSLEYKPGNYISYVDPKESKNEIVFEDLLQKARGLKLIIILQIGLLGCAVIARLFLRRLKSKRRRYR